MAINSVTSRSIASTPALARVTTGTQPAVHPTGYSGASGFDGTVAKPSGAPPFTGGGAPVFSGFDAEKLAAPLKLQEDGRPKSAKYTFAQLAQQSGSMPKSKAEAEQWFNANIRPGMAAAGFQVDEVKGDRAFIHTRENPQGEWVDFVQGAASGDPKLAWQPDGPGGAAPPAAAFTLLPLTGIDAAQHKEPADEERDAGGLRDRL